MPSFPAVLHDGKTVPARWFSFRRAHLSKTLIGYGERQTTTKNDQRGRIFNMTPVTLYTRPVLPLAARGGIVGRAVGSLLE